MELNPRFTISGLPNDVPVSYSEGRRRILSDAVGNPGLRQAGSNALLAQDLGYH
jgi:hypothetical protein